MLKVHDMDGHYTINLDPLGTIDLIGRWPKSVCYKNKSIWAHASISMLVFSYWR